MRSFAGVHDGKRVERFERKWGVFNGTILLLVELKSTDKDAFEPGTFLFAGYNKIKLGGVMHDTDQDGVVDMAEEVTLASGGSVRITGENTSWEVSIELELENGELLVGRYKGQYCKPPVYVFR